MVIRATKRSLLLKRPSAVLFPDIRRWTEIAWITEGKVTFKGLYGHLGFLPVFKGLARFRHENFLQLRVEGRPA